MKHTEYIFKTMPIKKDAKGNLTIGEVQKTKMHHENNEQYEEIVNCYKTFNETKPILFEQKWISIQDLPNDCEGLRYWMKAYSTITCIDHKISALEEHEIIKNF